MRALAHLFSFRKRTHFLAALLLLLACVHCTRSIFFDNVSWIDLQLYANGKERLPFQERVGMMYPLRLAEQSRSIQMAARLLDREEKHQVGRRVVGASEPMSPEKLMSLVFGLGSNLLAIGILSYFGWRLLHQLWWLPGTLFLAILYASYAARFEEAYWYPYDLPHMLIFGLACLCILEDRLWPLLPLFVLDTFVRETSVYLVLLSQPMLTSRLGWKRATVFSTAMVALWLGIRLPITHHFASNSSETGSRLLLNLRNLSLPLHWPQMASAAGFLLLPVWLGKAQLEAPARRFLWAALPCFVFTCVFGIWIESRIFLEWTIPVAALAAAEIVLLLQPSPTTALPSRAR